MGEDGVVDDVNVGDRFARGDVGRISRPGVGAMAAVGESVSAGESAAFIERFTQWPRRPGWQL